MFGFGKSDDKKEDDAYNTSLSAARRQSGEPTPSARSQAPARAAPQQRIALASPPGGSAIPAHMDDN